MTIDPETYIMFLAPALIVALALIVILGAWFVDRASDKKKNK